ncbi:pyridoxamine 5'-phosphate oxidase family protein [Psittacicella gerlachiana]|uniref:Pyridoxamine 5'-phosphate oxidase N-terminal domain-containing protein n=1 Tax=Psittacicella gerlachiana TaxID=2028574 RepID=A0A3A1YH03_9GAMM|nr:pyridoxamine 5'-phosphate oxidase family protein [Psittacicella gerlachiana]RIY37523.1 hypothetical protein CKF59_01605 [Psittacicella gerlachiana]
MALDPQEKVRRLTERLNPEIAELKANVKTAIISSYDKDGVPNASYSPFAIYNGFYYILISDVAKHAENLRQTGKAHILLIEDEAQARNIYARKRLSFHAQVQAVESESAEFTAGVQALGQRFGEIVSELSTMRDFNLFRLEPQDGLYVKGFGQAFNVGSDELVEPVHITKGHLFDQREAVELDK